MYKPVDVNLPAGVLDETIDRLNRWSRNPELAAQHRRNLSNLAKKLTKLRGRRGSKRTRVSPFDILKILRMAWEFVTILGVLK